MSEIYTRHHYVPETDTSAIERIQDCTPIAEHAKMLRQMGQTGDKEFRHAAHFPAVAVETYCNTHHITFEEFIREPKHAKAMLNDPALKAFRVWEGQA
jgi:hypothetical protein